MPTTAKEIKFQIQIGNRIYKYPVNTWVDGDRLYFGFDYNPELIAEVKPMKGARWSPEQKAWHIPVDEKRNTFQIQHLMGLKPYAPWDEKVDASIFPKVRYHKSLGREVPLLSHQPEMAAEMYWRPAKIIAGEMGTSKTLSNILAGELRCKEYREKHGDNPRWIYVAPRGVIAAVQREFRIWGCLFQPEWLTYEGLVKLIKNWTPGQKAPYILTLDEASKVKNENSQRAQAAQQFADGIRNDWGTEGRIILMSGSPAPKSPADWYSLCLSGDNWILTTQGPRQIRELVDTPCEVHVDGRNYPCSGFWKTGKKEVYRLVTKEGYTLKATTDHRILTSQGWIELGQLKSGDRVKLNQSSLSNWPGNGGFKEGYSLGFLIGDGTIDKRFNIGVLKFNGDDTDLLPFFRDFLKDTSVTRGKSSTGKDYYTLTSKNLTAIVRNYGLDSHKNVIEKESKSFLCGMISGLFDSDGCVEKSRLRITFAQENYTRIVAVQRILNYLGIFSEMRFQDRKDSKILGRTVKSKEYWTLSITGESAKKFYYFVGFKIPRKQSILRQRVARSHDFTLESPFATVKVIELCDIEDVYDASVPGIQTLPVNGILAHNCEIACPGFLKEGDINKFKRRLGIIVQKQAHDGGVYPQLVTWRDNEKLCDFCGLPQDAEPHEPSLALPQDPTKKQMEPDKYHPWKASKNEVKALYSRLTGLVSVYFKKDVLDLPDKHYRIIECKPSKSILRSASLITRGAPTTIQGLTLLRELSDGFQYKDIEDGYDSCPLCKGAKEIEHVKEIPGTCPNCKLIESTAPLGPSEEARIREGIHDYAKEVSITQSICGNHQPQVEKSMISCPTCGGTGEVRKYRRDIQEVACPKDEVLSDILDEHEDIGRIVIFAGFTGSIDRCVRLCQQAGWSVIRMDQGQVKIADARGVIIPDKDFISVFQDARVDHPKVAFVAHPKSGGMGLTLTASPTIVYFSNTFDGEDRIQSEDRIHRTGMDLNRGATIIDIVHLPSDQKILDNLKKKRDLQALTLGDFAVTLNEEGEVVR